MVVSHSGATLGNLVSSLYPSVAVGAISLDQMVAQIVDAISALNAGGINPATGQPSPFGPGYMQSILPLELRGLINSEHGDQESSSMYGESLL